MESKTEEEPKKSDDFWKADKFIFGTIIILGYMAGWLMTGHVAMTPEQAQLFAQGLATLGPVVGMIAASIWKFAKDELEERKIQAQAITTLADKTPPATVPKEELTYDPAITIPVESPVDGSADAPWFNADATDTLPDPASESR